MQENGEWHWKRFGELSTHALYDLLALRCEVFIVEQECAYLDIDGLDRDAWHCLYYEQGKLLAYQRSLAPGESYPDASALGRVIVSASARGRGLSRQLLRRGIAFHRERWPRHPLRISAQAHLEALYRSLGFMVSGEAYDEDGIPHLPMELGVEAPGTP